MQGGYLGHPYLPVYAHTILHVDYHRVYEYHVYSALSIYSVEYPLSGKGGYREG